MIQPEKKLVRKILWGVCGIGSGHTQRQLPLIEHFSADSKIVIFAYDSSFEFYSQYFEDSKNITVLNVAVPFYVGSKDGIDFEATKKLERNKKDYADINGQAKAKCEEMIGVPDLVISDYEPISAEYAYQHKVPLVTIDQQSKYLAGEFPPELHGQTYADEIARLKLFFPVASARIATSFFNCDKKKVGEEVLMFPPIFRESIVSIKDAQMKTVQTTPVSEPGLESGSRSRQISVLVYFSAQQEFPQALEEVSELCLSCPDVQFHLFSPDMKDRISFQNVFFYKHGDGRFGEILKNCSGIVSTAGHTLLSEAMYLGIPVYAVPLPVYEQQMNTEIIGKCGFGVRADTINVEKLQYFISSLDSFKDAIAKDTTVLIRGNGKEKIVGYLETHYFRGF